MKFGSILLSALMASAVVAAPADARKKKKEEQQVPVRPAPILAFAASGNAQAVNFHYERRQEAPIWFTAAGGTPAVNQLLAILRRAPIDGHAIGPERAAQVESFVMSAKTGDPVAMKTAERALSNAWVDYVQSLERPMQGVLFGDPYLAPKPDHPDRILARLAAAPSIAEHLVKVSSINPIYDGLRSAALIQAANGQTPTKLLLNMERARMIPADGRFILVNVTDARLFMYDGGQPVGDMKVVVGKPEGRLTTPMIASTMHYAVLNPYWHVPEHLENMWKSRILADPAGYLKARNYEIISSWGENAQVIPVSSFDWAGYKAGTVKLHLRQRPGGTNSMGKMKFPFPNSEGIYLHDTPMKVYFDKSDRALSNGCIRVEQYKRLADWLFMGQAPVLADNAPEQAVPLPRGVPVYVTYLTVVPDGEKLVEYRDPYGMDRTTQVSAAVSIPRSAYPPEAVPASVVAASGTSSR